ncbi:MAG TPA: GDP-mannose 4,6-dehydratase [Candidatus Nanoarchaeia archaeon]|nr:GDP-mannose 4,6-dehydratase [Candidatus Nanoarchaeia archaeon]
MKKALITGITGQDGSYLAEFLLDKGYEVHGIVRRAALEDPMHRLGRIYHLRNKLILHPGDIESFPRIFEIVEKVKPDECYHLAAQSFVHESFQDSFSTMDTNVGGTHHILSAIHSRAPKCKFYFAATSEMFGVTEESPQKETTRFHPRSPYGVSKVAGYELTRNYRESYDIFACSGILFNHESPRRGYEFVTRKITSAVARIKYGKTNVLILGNLSAKRDWGFAGDYVKAMWLMLQQNNPQDYVIATGENHTIKEFIDLAFQAAGVSYKLIDLSKLSEKEADAEVQKLEQKKGEIFVVQHPRFYRPAEIHELLGDSSKAKKELNWKTEVSLKELIKMMVENDLKKESGNH